MNLDQRLDLIERRQAEMQGAVCFLLALEGANCAGRYKPGALIELKERVVSNLLGSSLRGDAVEGSEAALAVVLGTLALVDSAIRNRAADGVGGA